MLCCVHLGRMIAVQYVELLARLFVCVRARCVIAASIVEALAHARLLSETYLTVDSFASQSRSSVSLLVCWAAFLSFAQEESPEHLLCKTCAGV